MQLGHRMPDGATVREHLQAGARQTGVADPRLVARVPAGGAALWEAFVALSAARPPGFDAMGAIPPSELLAWQRLHGVRFSAWEVETLEHMDRAARAAARSAQ